MSDVQTCKNSKGKEFPVGEGYRLLEEGETIPEGYECLWNGEGWVPGSIEDWKLVGEVWSDDCFVPFRVKLPEPPNPQALEEETLEHLGEGTRIAPDPKTKYLRDIYPVDGTVHTDANGKQFVRIDVYSVLLAFGVDHPTGHAVKKLLCAGMRGKGDRIQDLTEAKVAIDRAIQEAGI